MSSVGGVPARVDRLVLRALGFGQKVLFWPVFYAIAWAAALWPLAHRERLEAWRQNDLTELETGQQLVYLFVAFGITAVVWLALAGLGRVFKGRWDVQHSARSFNRLFAFSLAAPFVTALSAPGVESSRALHTLFFIAVTAVCVLPTVAFMWEASRPFHIEPLPPWRLRLRSVALPLFLLGVFVGYAVWFSHLAINNHHALQTRIFDLAIYDNIFYQSSHGNPLGCSLSRTGTHVNAHFDAILVLLSPLYLIYPRAELILVLQAIWCGAGVVPAYLLGRHHAGSTLAGVVLALAWALYPALHGANLYEFHSLTLLAMPMLWLLYLLTAGHLRAFFVLLPFVLLIREDASLLVCFVAVAAIFTREPRYVRAGWITFVIAALYFVLIKAFIMGGGDPLGGKGGFAWYYADLIPERGGLLHLIKSVLVNPTFAFEFALREPKVIFLLQLLLPLAFLPLLADRWRFAAAFGLFYILMGSRKTVYSIHFQYSVVLFPVLFMLTAVALRRLQEGSLPRRLGLERGQLLTVLLACIVVSSALTSWKFGGAVPNRSFRGGWAPIPHTLSDAQKERYESFRDFIEQVPPDAALTVLGRFGPHLSNRAEVYRYNSDKKSEYLIFDSRDLRSHARTRHRERVIAGEVELMDKRGTYELYRVVR